MTSFVSAGDARALGKIARSFIIIIIRVAGEKAKAVAQINNNNIGRVWFRGGGSIINRLPASLAQPASQPDQVRGCEQTWLTPLTRTRIPIHFGWEASKPTLTALH